VTWWLTREPYGISDLVLSGFLRIVTNPKVFRQPTPRDFSRFPGLRWRHPLDAYAAAAANGQV
jgi:hypothetical protein